MSTWILLRGLTRERGHWGRFPEALQRRLPSSAIVALDFPGNGAYHPLRSPTRIAEMTDWCLEQIRVLGIAPPYGLIAMSMGAMVAIDWAGREPQSIAGCVLINTSMRPFDPWYRRLLPRNFITLVGLALPGRSAAGRERTILRMTSRNSDAADAVLGDWTRLRHLHPVSSLNALRQLYAAASFIPKPQAPPVPLLVLGSREDGLVDGRCSLDLAQRWQTEFAIHAGAGHDLPLDDPTWVAGHIAGWTVRQAFDDHAPVSAK
jgi:pimeloyl-ACP methyl ester carboxylesterase